MKQFLTKGMSVIMHGLVMSGIVMMAINLMNSNPILPVAAAMEGTKGILMKGTFSETASAGDRVIQGVVKAVRGDLIEVEIHQKDEFNKDLTMSRFLTLGQAKDQGMKVKPDDKIHILVNSQNLVEDFQLVDKKG